ncbi:glycosyl hydrolase, partial [Candidatus Woesearchaeota archaeon CG_4_10_14_0_8_um_filter_47_5]
YVKAESRGRGIREEFWFDEAWFLWNFSFDNFVRLVREDVIKTDIRIGQYPDGRPHDHGTGFRVMPNKLELCFEHRQRII